MSDDLGRASVAAGALFAFTLMNVLPHFRLLLAAVTLWSVSLEVTQAPAKQDPRAYVYERIADREMKLYVFEPERPDRVNYRAAMLMFHGGGWTEGSAEWTFGQAQYFATLGMVGISVDYRLADGKETTPLDSADDARAAIRWVRTHAKELRIDRDQIVAYGESAGGQLAAVTAIIGANPTKDELKAVPNALVLFSPAIEIEKSGHFKILMAGKELSNSSVAEHVRKGMPPTLVVAGELDRTIPVEGLKEFCKRMKQARNQCDVDVFKGVGHVLWAVDETQKSRELAAKAKFDALLKVDEFLALLGYIKASPHN